ncbi:hypothetical protein SIO70_32405 [Chitinophaga sancti]|uniref:hypothetical protein n=1 Tax=Chitinophaga sancti TaxID=1004 RepID=UPI002A760461|nr:hypothetical protein [Chitinophaga sancti]WPQ63071.1 hypothetical protein SIO70_32405 [Chitinophaga sancti]
MIRIRVKKPKHPDYDKEWYPKPSVLSQVFRPTGAVDRMIEKLNYLSEKFDKEIPVDQSNKYSLLYGSRVVEVCPYLRVKYMPDYTNPEDVKHLEIPLADIWNSKRPPTEEEIIESIAGM